MSSPSLPPPPRVKVQSRVVGVRNSRDPMEDVITRARAVRQLPRVFTIQSRTNKFSINPTSPHPRRPQRSRRRVPELPNPTLSNKPRSSPALRLLSPRRVSCHPWDPSRHPSDPL